MSDPSPVRCRNLESKALPRWPFLVVTSVFLLSRGWARWAGVRFNVHPLKGYWQFLDVRWLTEDLARSLYSLHMQPPLFNAWLGAALKLDTVSPATLFGWSYLAIGLGIALGLCGLAMRLGADPWLAALAALLFAVGPTAILYENWLFYTYPVTLVIVLAALGLERFARTQRLVDGLIAFGILALAVWTRSLFHLAWLVLAVALTAWILAERRRIVVLAALPALILCAGLYLKNLAEFGVFGTSSWIGMNLSKLTTRSLPRDLLEREIADGAISRLALAKPFQALGRYPLHYHQIDLPAAPALSEPLKQSGGPNLNHLAYVGISRTYLHDSLVLLARYPGNYLSNAGRAWLIFLRSPTESVFVKRNRLRILGWDRLYTSLVYGAPARFHRKRLPPLGKRFRYHQAWRRVGWLFSFLLVAGTAYGVVAGLRAREPDRAMALTLLFVVFTIAWVALVGNLLEIGENNRFRVLIEPLVLAMAGAGIGRLGRWLRSRGVPGYLPRRRLRHTAKLPNADIDECADNGSLQTYSRRRRDSLQS